MSTSDRIALTLHSVAFLIFAGLVTVNLATGRNHWDIIVVSVMLGLVNLWRIITVMRQDRR